MNTFKQSTLKEEVVASTVQGLLQLEKLLGYEFTETIDTIERLHRLQEAENAMAEYAEASGKGVARRIVALNQEAK